MMNGSIFRRIIQSSFLTSTFIKTRSLRVIIDPIKHNRVLNIVKDKFDIFTDDLVEVSNNTLDKHTMIWEFTDPNKKTNTFNIEKEKYGSFISFYSPRIDFSLYTSPHREIYLKWLDDYGWEETNKQFPSSYKSSYKSNNYPQNIGSKYHIQVSSYANPAMYCGHENLVIVCETIRDPERIKARISNIRPGQTYTTTHLDLIKPVYALTAGVEFVSVSNPWWDYCCQIGEEKHQQEMDPDRKNNEYR